MTSERLQEQACLYAAGALPPHETRAMEEAMRSDPALRQLVEDLQNVGESLAASIPQLPPPPGAKQKIFARLDALPSPAVITADFPRSATRRAVPLWVPLALAASIVLFGGILMVNRNGEIQRAAESQKQIQALESNVAELSEQARTMRVQSVQFTNLQGQLDRAVQRMLTLSTQTVTLEQQLRQTDVLRRDLESAARRAAELSTQSAALQARLAELQGLQNVSLMQIKFLKSLLENSPDSVGVSIWDKENQKGVFVADNMPLLPDDKQYQLWILDPKYTSPVSAGIFSVDAKGHARVEFQPALAVERSDHFAVSIERRGGTTQPEGRVVLLTP